MEIEDLQALFDKHDGEYLEFGRITNPKSKRPDLHAFMLLDQICPGTSDIVSCSEHDEIYLDVSAEDLAAVATEDQVIELIRCGVRLDGEEEYLCMFT